MSLHVMQWLNMITDQVDIRSGVKIERRFYTPADLRTGPDGGNIIDDVAAGCRVG
ncbi:MAG TPA: hypothetical protein VHG92_02695 [Afifellaceae bacterium]|nr:hypothetical protein [Afifellaceae bacterium]